MRRWTRIVFDEGLVVKIVLHAQDADQLLDLLERFRPDPGLLPVPSGLTGDEGLDRREAVTDDHTALRPVACALPAL